MNSYYGVVYRYVVPAIKKELAEELYKRKLSRVEIAKPLKLSASFISRYIKGEGGL